MIVEEFFNEKEYQCDDHIRPIFELVMIYKK